MSDPASRSTRTKDDEGRRMGAAPILLGLILVAQLVVLTPLSLLLLPLGGPYAPSVLLNLLMAYLVWRSLSGRISKAWLLVPGAFFLGWFAYSAVDFQRAKRVHAALDAPPGVRGAGTGQALVVLKGDGPEANLPSDVDYFKRIRPRLKVEVQGDGPAPNRPAGVLRLTRLRPPAPGELFHPRLTGLGEARTRLPGAWRIERSDGAGGWRTLGVVYQGVVRYALPVPLFSTGCLVTDIGYSCDVGPLRGEMPVNSGRQPKDSEAVLLNLLGFAAPDGHGGS